MFFPDICEKVGTIPTVDMFASRLNKKLDKYIAWQPDPDAWAIDAFTFDREPIIGFYFAPFNMVSRVLEKMEADRATHVVVLPSWPTQTWFPKYVDMASGEIFYFDMWPDNLFLPFKRNQQHKLEERRFYWWHFAQARVARTGLLRRSNHHHHCFKTEVYSTTVQGVPQ